MARPHHIVGLDIGTQSIKIISALKNPEEENFEVLGKTEEFSFGVRKGIIIDPRKTGEIIASLASKIKQETGQKIDGVFANIGGGHLSCVSSHGLVSVSRADRKISDEDVDRAIQAAKTFLLPSNKEIIDIFPKDFAIDGEKGIKQPSGLEGVRLEADILAICCFSPYLKNSTQAILNSGLQINDLIPSSLAAARAVLTPREKELGVVVLDIGAGTSDMAVFEEGELIDVAVFPIGSENITNDIAICLPTDVDLAEKIKLEFGSYDLSANIPKKTSRADKKIRIEGEEPLIFSQKRLNQIIEARVCEIFGLVNKELKRISRQGMLPGGLVLTGGGAKLPGIKNLAKKELKLPCRIGVAYAFPSLDKDPSVATLCGLAMYGFEAEEEHYRESFHLFNWLKRVLRVFIP
jgi:cell division protein FtsA